MVETKTIAKLAETGLLKDVTPEHVKKKADELAGKLRERYPNDCEQAIAMLEKYPGLAMMWGTPEKRDEYEERDRQKIEKAFLRESAIPKHHRVIFPTGHPAWMAARDRLESVIGTGFVRVILGDTGTGKTQLACDVIRCACQQGRSATYRTAMQFFNDLRSAGYRTNAVVGKWMSWTLLVIDEADVKGDRRWEDQTLIDLIDRRYRDDKGTIMVSNLNEHSFFQMIGDKVRDRIIETGGIITANWPSYRRTKP